MSQSDSWSDQWFKAQQQFVDAWSDMARSGTEDSKPSQSDLWAQSFDLWRQACGPQTQPDVQRAMKKCLDMGKEYFAMAEQVSKSMANGANPVEAINQWMEQLRQTLQQAGNMPGFDGSHLNNFMKQWFSPTTSWQQMATAFAPMTQSAWQMPGMNTAGFNMGEAIDPLGKILSAPGIGYFREPQEKQQQGLQLAMEYQQANAAFNQAFLQVALESIREFQFSLTKLGSESQPKSLRELYDLWVETSESHYASFAMSEDYQALYGDMVNRLMRLKKHYSEMTDDYLSQMNLPNRREVDTMQQRLQHLRRENITLKKEVSEIRSMLEALAKPAAVGKEARAAPARKTTSTSKASAKKTAARKSPPKKTAVKKSPSVKTAVKKSPSVKTAVKKSPPIKTGAKKKAAVSRKTGAGA